MAVKTKSFTYRTHVKWENDRSGKMSSPGKPDLQFAAPPEFKGREGVWTPEDLYVAALNTCFMLTFEGTAKWKGLEFISFECDAEGLLEKPEDEFLFTVVHLRPRLVLPEDGDEDLARWCVEHAKKDCLVTHSIRSDVTVSLELVKAAED
jgi:organic hydroperoxide reductase OsmC/OhrA